jgi:lysine-specific histone demethylase 1
MYGRSIPQPAAIMRTRWASDPFALGAYSHVPPGATPEDFNVLAEQVGSTLFFAGEATSRQFPGAVQGAYLSGKREAAKILAGGQPPRR